MDYSRLLEDKKILITAGAHGMGFTTARLFAKHGATVAVTGRRAEGEKSAEYLRKYTKDSFFRLTDMGNVQDVADCCDEVLDRFGYVDAIVNVVGVNDMEFSYKITDEKYDRIQNTNIRSIVTINKKLLPVMIERGQGGSLVHISTIHSVASFPRMGSYAVSKGGINAYSRVMAIELGRYGIRSNVVCPGGITTGRMLFGHQSDPKRQEFIANSLQHQGGEPTFGPGHSFDIANACLYFVSDMSSFVTGSTLMVDGGASNQLHAVEEFMTPADYEAALDAYAKTFLSDEEMMERML